MYDAQTLLLFGMALAFSAGAPGPAVAALVARVVSGGPRSILPFLVAMWIGEAIWLACAVLGLAVLAQSFQTAFSLLKWIGIGYLFYLAWKTWSAPVTETALPVADSPTRMFVAGLTLALGSPEIMLFYVALLPSILDLSSVTFAGWAELTLVMAAVLIALDLTWVLIASQARRLFRTAVARRRANRLSAGMMMLAATAMATR